MTLARSAKDPGRVKGAMQVALWGTTVASTVATIALLVWADPIASLFNDDPQKESDFVELIRIGSPYIVLYSLMQVMRYCTQSYKTMVPSVMVGNVIQPAARFVIGVGVLIAGAGVAGVLVAANISVAIALVAAAWYLRQDADRSRGCRDPAARDRPDGAVRASPGRILVVGCADPRSGSPDPRGVSIRRCRRPVRHRAQPSRAGQRVPGRHREHLGSRCLGSALQGRDRAAGGACTR